MLAAALLLGSVISTWHALRARQAEALAKTGFEAEKEARGRAVAEAAKATAISALLQDALQSADPYKAKGSDYTVRQLLDDLSRSLGERLKDQPEAEAATRSTIGIAYSGLGRPGDAEPHLQRALDLRRTLLGPDHIEVAQSLLAHSYNAFQLGNPAAAEREAREALDISRKTADTRETTLYAFGLLAFFLEQQQKHAESRAAAEEALAFARNAGFSDHPEVAKILHNQVQLRINLGDLDGAEKLARDALAMHRRVHGTDHPEFGWGLYKLGVALEKRGEYAESEEKLRGALTIFRKHFDEKRILIVSAALQHTLLARGDEAGAAELRADDDSRLAKALELQKGNSNLRMLLGNRLRDSGDLDRAIAQYSEVITRDPTSMDAWVARGECRFRQREYVGAAADFAAAVKLKPEHRSTMAQDQMAHCHRTLGEALVHTAKPQEAQEAFQNSIDIWSALATAHPKGAGYRHALAYAYQLLANLHASQRRFADADAGYEKAADCTEKLIAEFNDAEYRNRLGSILLHWAFSCKADNRLKEAERCFRDAVLAFESLRTNSPKDNRWAIHELGYIQLNLGDLLSGLSGREEDAEKAYRQSADYHEKQLAQDAENADYQQRLTWSYSGLAGFLRKTGKRLEALQLDAKRIVLVNKLTPSATLTAEMNTLAWKLATDPDPKLRDPSQAVSLAKKAVELASAQGKYWTTLGVAHYRASDWKSAIAALEQSLKLRNGGDAVDWFFLAMANWKLNDIRAARNWYDKALGWMDKYQLAGEEQNEELSRFRGEATELLDLKSKKD
jgi:tetratricopeptide (TPR) repeat protein